MVKVTFYLNHQNRISGFDSMDHAGYGQEGSDIVCAAVSALVINCINSVEELTHTDYTVDMNEQDASIRFRITSDTNEQSEHWPAG